MRTLLPRCATLALAGVLTACANRPLVYPAYEVLDSPEWQAFKQTMALRAWPAVDGEPLERDCRAAMKPLGPQVSVAPYLLACINAAVSGTDALSWYQSVEGVQALPKEDATGKAVVVAALEGGVLYLGLPPVTQAAVEAVILQLSALPAPWEPHAIILDLRSNSGGAIRNLELVAALFMDEGSRLGRVVGPDSQEIKARADPARMAKLPSPLRQALRTRPMAVLVDASTASGTAMLAQSLRVHRGAQLVGQPFPRSADMHTLQPLTVRGHWLKWRSGALTFEQVEGFDAATALASLRPDVTLAGDKVPRPERGPWLDDDWIAQAHRLVGTAQQR